MQPTAAEIEAYKITVTVPVDTSKLRPPVPEGEQDPNFFYCTYVTKDLNIEDISRNTSTSIAAMRK